MRAWRRGRQRAWGRRGARNGSRWNTWNRHAVNNVNCINAPAFTGATVIARHAPAQSFASETDREVNDSSDKALRISAPGLTTCNRTAPVTADCAIVTTHDEPASNSKNVLKCISPVSAHLEYAAIEPNIWVRFRSFKIKILVKGQLTRSDRKLYRVEALITNDSWIINECGIRLCIGRWRGHAAIGCNPERQWAKRICG